MIAVTIALEDPYIILIGIMSHYIIQDKKMNFD